MKYFKALWAALIAVFGVLVYASVSSALVEPLPDFFRAAAKPVILPSGLCFSICWCLVYIFSTAAIARIVYLRDNYAVCLAFVASGVFNAVWQAVFFKGGFIEAATVLMFFLCAYKILCLLFVFKTDRAAGLFFTPVTIWYCFLCVLQYSFWLLNK